MDHSKWLWFFIVLASSLNDVHCAARTGLKHVTCERTFQKLGCFGTEDNDEVDNQMEIVISDRADNSQYIFDWLNPEESAHSLACRCASAAKAAGKHYFSLRFYAECWIPVKENVVAHNEVDALVERLSPHTDCMTANSYTGRCNKNEIIECIGKSLTAYMYKVEEEFSNEQSVDGGYTKWSEYSPCTRSCGLGLMTRERTCTDPIPEGAGKDCERFGPTTETKQCIIQECPVDGGYSKWSNYSPCTASCGTGVEIRTRTCNNPVPKGNGKNCDSEGPAKEERKCNKGPCPVDGGYSKWSNYSPCTASCGTGVEIRTRTCNNPAPKGNGKNCDSLGPAKEERKCNKEPCPAISTCRMSDASFGHARISITGKKVLLKWNNGRPDASGQIDETQKVHTGHVTFPDDRKYTFNYYPGDADIYWGGVKGKTGNIWRGQCPAAQTGGSTCRIKNVNFHQASLHISGNDVRLKWKNNRPDAFGKIDESKSTPTGTVTFPDDRKYSFNYYPDEAAIYWDGVKGKTSNIWRGECVDNNAISTCRMSDASFGHARISITGKKVLLKWNNGRPDASGQIDETQKVHTGHVTFPDDRKYTFNYYPGDTDIYWGGVKGKTGNIWRGQCPAAKTG